MYRIEVTDSSGSVLADLSTRFTELRFGKVRNAPDSIDVSFDLYNLRDYCKRTDTTVAALFRVNVNELHIYRDDTQLIAGQINYVESTLSGSAAAVRVRAAGFFALLSSRYTSSLRQFTSVDAGEIAWTLIEESQALTYGNLGITEGTIATSVTRNRTYSYKNVKEAIEQLASVVNGFDFEVTPSKVFNVYYPKIGVRRASAAFTIPGNIISFSLSEDGTRVVNETLAIGGGSGDTAIRTTSASTDSQQAYTLRQNILLVSDVILLATLQQHADGDVAAKRKTYVMPDILLDGNVAPTLGYYGIGDEVLVSVEETDVFGAVTGYWRIEAINATVTPNGKEQVRVRMAS